MRYIPSTDDQLTEMLEHIGVSSFEELIKNVPNNFRLKSKLKLPKALSEQELEEYLVKISQKNSDFYGMKPLVGAGAYRHFIPQAVRSLLQREEFWT